MQYITILVIHAHTIIGMLKNFVDHRYWNSVNFWDLFMGILNAQVPQLAKRFAFISWSIWYKRNAARLDSPSLPYSKIHANAIERLREFQQAQDLPSYSMSPLLWSTGLHLSVCGSKPILMAPSFKTLLQLA